MQTSKKEYDKLVKTASKNSPKLKDFLMAFLVGGLICVLGQFLMWLYQKIGLSEKEVRMAVPSSLVFLAALLTGIGWFDKIAKHAGAGTLVPITGFANAVVSPCIEFKNEGWVLGLGSSAFKIAGAVIVYGTAASVVYGLILYLASLF